MLHALLEWGNVILHEGCMSVVLCHIGEAILVKGPILAVALIDLGLEGREDVVNHGVDLVLPKEMGMEGAIHLASILGRCELLHMLPHAGGREQRVEDRRNLFRVSEKGWDKGSRSQSTSSVTIGQRLMVSWSTEVYLDKP
jgi:hypothetical protein